MRQIEDPVYILRNTPDVRGRPGLRRSASWAVLRASLIFASMSIAVAFAPRDDAIAQPDGPESAHPVTKPS